MSKARIAVLGLGNLMRTDDALGMLAVQQLRLHPDLPAEVRVIEGGTLGLDLLYPLEGVTHLMALDAVEMGASPGTLFRFSGEEIAALPVAKSVHLLGFSDLLGAMRLTGNVPGEVVVLGVQPQSVGWGTELTPPVQAAVSQVIRTALHQVAAWSAMSSTGAWAVAEPDPPPEIAADL